MTTPADQLNELKTSSDRLDIDGNGDLVIEQVSASALLEKFGSPLYVTSEATLRENFRRIQTAFAHAWPKPVNVMYAIKTNTNLAIRAILHQEGAGGDCFGEGELHATFEGGADPVKIALNGSNKSIESLRIGVEKGVTVNIDAREEIDQLVTICQALGKTVKVNIRLKAMSDNYQAVNNEYLGGADLVEYVRRSKWGFSVETAEHLVKDIQTKPELDLTGFSCHIGRVSQGLAFLKEYGRSVGSMVVALELRTGFTPRVLDIGGGWARQRDPESKSLALHETQVEECVSAACGAILNQLNGARLEIPVLWAEPGRYIIGNAMILLSTVGNVKQDLGLTWVNIDASTNDLPRIDTSGSAYHVVAASGMHRPSDQVVSIVGGTCAD